MVTGYRESTFFLIIFIYIGAFIGLSPLLFHKANMEICC